MTTSWVASGNFSVPADTAITLSVSNIDDDVNLTVFKSMTRTLGDRPIQEWERIFGEDLVNDWSQDFVVDAELKALIVLDNSGGGTFHAQIGAWPQGNADRKFFNYYPNGWDLFPQQADWTGTFIFSPVVPPIVGRVTD